MYSASMDVPHYWTADQVKRLLDALASHNRHQARTAALIMWRTGLRVSEVLELEWRDLDYSGDPATLLVRKSKSRRARTVRLHPDLVQLFTNWPANRSPRDKLVPLSMRTSLRHIGDGIEWAGLDEESPGTGQRRAGGCGPVARLSIPLVGQAGVASAAGRDCGRCQQWDDTPGLADVIPVDFIRQLSHTVYSMTQRDDLPVHEMVAWLPQKMTVLHAPRRTRQRPRPPQTSPWCAPSSSRAPAAH